VELLLAGQSVGAVCKILKIDYLPRPLVTYLFCSPGLDRELRCLPKEGGYLDQDYLDMYYFRIIEERIGNWQARQAAKDKNKSATNAVSGSKPFRGVR
jgi:hypothetical protein